MTTDGVKTCAKILLAVCFVVWLWYFVYMGFGLYEVDLYGYRYVEGVYSTEPGLRDNIQRAMSDGKLREYERKAIESLLEKAEVGRIVDRLRPRPAKTPPPFMVPQKPA